MRKYTPVQNESAHLTDMPYRSAFEAKKHKHGSTETPQKERPFGYEKGRRNKSRS